MAVNDVEVGLGIEVAALAGVGVEVLALLKKEVTKAAKSAGLDKALAGAVGDNFVKGMGSVGPKMNRALDKLLKNLSVPAAKAGRASGAAYGEQFVAGVTLGASELDVALAKEIRGGKNATVRAAKEVTKAVQIAETQATARTIAITEAGNKRHKQSMLRRAAETRAALKRTDADLEISARKSIDADKRTSASRVRSAALADQAVARVISSDASLVRSAQTTQRTLLRLPEERRRTEQQAEAQRLTAQRQAQRLEVIQAVQAARARAAVEVAEVQQQERRTTLRLQRFNALTLQITQSFLTRLRDARRAHNQREIVDIQSADKRQERELRQSLTRREVLVQRSQSRLTALQSKSTAAALAAQTSTGVIGAARGVGALGQTLRSVALIGGGALSIRALFRTAQDFLANFRRLGAITGATDVQMKALRTTAIALGNDLALPGVSAADAAEALTRLVQAGFSVEQAIGAAKGTLLLARNNTIDFGEAAEFVGSQVNSFGISAAAALGIVDVAQRSLVSGGGQSFTELQQAIQQSGAVFSQFFTRVRGGQGAFEDLNIALDILAKNGLRGSDAGTSLKTFLLGLGGSSEQASKLIAGLSKEINLTTEATGDLFFTGEGNIKPFLEIITNLRESLSGFTQEGQIDILKKVFGTDAFRAASIFIGQTDEELAAFTETIRTATGASVALGSAVNKGARAAFDNFISTVETVAIPVFEKLDPLIASVVTRIAGLISSLASGEGVFRTIRLGLAGVGVGLGIILAAKGAVEVLGAMKVILLGLASPVALAATAFLAIGGAIAIGIKASDDFREALGGLVGFARTNLLAPLASVGRAIGDALSGIFGGGGASQAEADIADRVEIFGQNVGKIRRTSAVFDAIGRTIRTVLLPALQTAATFVKDTLAPILAAVVKFFREKILPVIKDFAGLTVAAFKVVADVAKTVLLPPLQKIADGFRDGLGSVVSGAQASGLIGILQDIARVAGTVAKGIGEVFGGDFSKAGRTFVGLGKSIAAAISSALAGIDWGNVASTAFRGFNAAIRKIGSGLSGLFSKPVLAGLLAIVGSVAFIAGDIAVQFTIGFVKGVIPRLKDLGALIGPALVTAFVAAAKAIPGAFVAALKASFSSPLALLFAGLATIIAAALGAKLFSKLRNSFFKPLAETSRRTFQALRGDTDGAIRGHAAYRAELTRTKSAQEALKRSLGGGLTGSVLLGLDGAAKAVKGFNDTVFKGVQATVRQSGRALATLPNGLLGGLAQADSTGRLFGNALVQGVASAYPKIRTGFSRALDFLRTQNASFTSAFSTVGERMADRVGVGIISGLSGFFAGQSGGFGRIIGLASVAGTALSRALTGDFVGAGLVAGLGLLGFAFGNASKRAEEARARVKAFGDELRNQEDAVQGFADGVAAIAGRDAGLQRALADTGLSFSTFLDSLTTGGVAANVAAVSGALDGLRTSASALDVSGFRAGLASLGDAIPASVAAGLSKRLEEISKTSTRGAVQEMQVFLDQLDDDLLKGAAGTTKAGKEIDAALASIQKSLKETSLQSALALNFDAISGAFAKVRAEAGSLEKALITVLPGDLESQIRIISSSLGIAGNEVFPRLAGAISGSGEAFEAFRVQVLNGVAGLNLSQDESTALDLVLRGLRDAYLGAEGGAKLLRKEQEKEVKAKALVDLNSKWQEINTSTRTAISSAKEYFLLGESTPQLAIDQAAVNVGTASAELIEQIRRAQAKGLTVADLLNPLKNTKANIDGVIIDLGAEFRIDVSTLKTDLAGQLATALEGRPPEELPGIIARFLNASMQAAIAQGLDPRLISLDSFLSALAPELRSAFEAEFNKAVAAITLTPDLVALLKLNPEALPGDLAAFAKEFPFLVDAIIQDVITQREIILKASAVITDFTVTAKARAQVSAALALAGVGGLENGGIVTRPTISALGEGGKKEVVIPLTKPARARELAAKSGLLNLLGGGSDLRGAGFSVGEGAALGIREATGLVASAAAGLAGMVSNTFRRVLGIHSPSTVFEKYGKSIVEGLVKGIKEGTAAAGDAIQNFVDVFLGRLPAGGGPATGFDELLKALKAQLTDSLKTLGLDDIKAVTDAQANALRAISDISKDKDFKKGLSLTNATGAENRSELIDAIAAAREAIVNDLAAGDTAGAQAVFDQLQAALAKVAKANKGNKTVIDEILAALGLDGATPLADIAATFTDAEEELRKLIEAQTKQAEQQKKQQDAANTPGTQGGNGIVVNVTTYDPILLARRLVAENQRKLAGSLR